MLGTFFNADFSNGTDQMLYVPSARSTMSVLLGPVRKGSILAGGRRSQGAHRVPIGEDAVGTLQQTL